MLKMQNTISAIIIATLVASGAALAQGDAPPPPAGDEAAEDASADTKKAGADGAPADTAPADTAPADGAPADAAPADGAPEGTKPAPPDEEALRTADEAYQLRVRQLENDINDLKERIFRSKAKLTLLTEQVTGGAGTGASAIISHKWEMGGAFRLTEVHYFIDGAPIWQEVDETGTRLTGIERKQLFDGNLVEGSHTLSVKLVLRGNGSGVFSYLSDYAWTIQDKYTFTAEPGKVHNIVAVGFEKGNFTTELKDKPSLRFDVDIQVDNKKTKDEDGKAK